MVMIGFDPALAQCLREPTDRMRLRLFVPAELQTHGASVGVTTEQTARQTILARHHFRLV